MILSSCANHQNIQAQEASVNHKTSNDYAKIIAIPDIVKDLLSDPSTPTVGPQDANKAVVVFLIMVVVSVPKFLKKLTSL